MPKTNKEILDSISVLLNEAILADAAEENNLSLNDMGERATKIVLELTTRYASLIDMLQYIGTVSNAHQIDACMSILSRIDRRAHTKMIGAMTYVTEKEAEKLYHAELKRAVEATKRYARITGKDIEDAKEWYLKHGKLWNPYTVRGNNFIEAFSRVIGIAPGQDFEAMIKNSVRIHINSVINAESRK